MKRFLTVLFLVSLCFSVFALNVIYLIGDGMAANQVLLASILEGKILNIMKLPYTGLTTTYSYDSWVTDSAPAGTALASGFKTLNRAIGVLPNGEAVPSMIELAAERGFKTGIVVTCRVTHATPASFYGHVTNRDDEFTLAEQLANSKVDIIMGSGYAWFLPSYAGGRRTDGKNLIEQMTARGYTYVTKKSELQSVKSGKLLALFAPSHLDAVPIRSGEQPTLDEMVSKALEILSSSDEPFILMVEGSQIDWACHANDVFWMWKEMVEFDNAVKVAIDFAAKHGDTLVVVTGDHETGGLSLSNGGYTIEVEKARKVKGTADYFLSKVKLEDYEFFKNQAMDFFGVEISQDEFNYVKNASNKSYALSEIISKKLRIGWTTHDHTAAPVPVYAFGPGAEQFVGFMDNTDIAKTIMKLVGLNVLSFPKRVGSK